jgi:hypothetical protein
MEGGKYWHECDREGREEEKGLCSGQMTIYPCHAGLHVPAASKNRIMHPRSAGHGFRLRGLTDEAQRDFSHDFELSTHVV